MLAKRKHSSLCTLLLAVLFTLLGILFLSLLVTFSVQSALHRERQQNGGQIASRQTDEEARRCPYAVVYNKPGKTGSTFILQSIQKWAEATNRTVYTCSSKVRYNRIVFPECVEHDLSGCVVVAMHFELDDWALKFLHERIGKFIMVTSTRTPEMRLVSSAMQHYHITHEEAGANLTLIKDILRDKNPWYLYNYHTGENRRGSCPMSAGDESYIYRLARRYDVVIDLEHLEESNAVLRSKGLWNLPTGVQKNVRGTAKLQLDEEAKEMLRKVTCVEEVMHRILGYRMAHLYGLATGKPCLKARRQPTSCI